MTVDPQKASLSILAIAEDSLQLIINPLVTARQPGIAGVGSGGRVVGNSPIGFNRRDNTTSSTLRLAIVTSTFSGNAEEEGAFSISMECSSKASAQPAYTDPQYGV